MSFITLKITEEFMRTATARELIERQENLKNLLPMLYRGDEKRMAHRCLNEVKIELSARADMRKCYILRPKQNYSTVSL